MRFRFSIVLGVIGVAFVGCTRSLEPAKIEEAIKSEVVKQGGGSLKSVICPNQIRPQAGSSFECVGVLDSGNGFVIPVKQQDDRGTLVWDVPSVRGLINMAKLQTEFERGLKSEIGQASIDCGTTHPYRAVKPGESFECKLIKRDAAKAASIGAEPASEKATPNAIESADVVQVTIQPSGDINWQRLIKVPDPKASTAKDSPTPKPSPSPEAKPEATIAPSAPAGKSAEDFLKQPGAADDFN